jgi:mono/diheme cytochrome c family protein
MIGEKSTAFALQVSIVSSLLLACSSHDTRESETTASLQEALQSGTFTTNGNLTRTSKRQGAALSPDENARRADSDHYYQIISSPTSTPTLGAFKAAYFSNGETASARYYNRGDLGIGREMHCSDKTNNAFSGFPRYACYVTNFAAGDDNSDFTFGLSPGFAFRNMDQAHSFATVAMVMEQGFQGGFSVAFLVYGASANAATLDAAPLQNFAALDRVGLAYALEFAQNSQPDATKFGTPGTNFNNHIPTNCMSCHGGHGTYNGSSAAGATFLPFDLTQFDFDSSSGRTRQEQEASFRELNQFVRAVDKITGNPGPSGSVGSSIVAQIDRWYGNDAGSTTLSGNFRDHQVPTGWGNNDATDTPAETVYKKVVGPYCRNCHMAQDFKLLGQSGSNALVFDSEADFRAFGAGVGSICSSQMPHSLQTLRQFWQSEAPAALENWLANDATLAPLATTLRGCSPQTAVTLDAPVLAVLNGL